MDRPTGPFHSLTPTDQKHLRRLLRNGASVLAAAREIDCSYKHAWNFAHTHHLIDYRPHHRDPGTEHRFLDLLHAGNNIHQADTSSGLGLTRAYRLARDTGVHTPISHTQRRINATDQRVDYLRLRLASLTRRDAAQAIDISSSLASDYEQGVVRLSGPRQRFIPAGPHSRTYNRLMTALLTRTDVIEEGRLPDPTLPPGMDPYAPIHARYLNVDERIAIADLYREGHSMQHIARHLRRSVSTISPEIRRNHCSSGPYRAETAQKRATARRPRPKLGKLQAQPRLYDYVVAGLRAEWSPEEIARRLVVDFPDEQEMRVSHETIYDAFYLESKGRLKDLGLQLPTGRKKRRRRGSPRTRGTGRLSMRWC